MGRLAAAAESLVLTRVAAGCQLRPQERLIGQVYEEMADRAAEHFPADGRAVPTGARPAAASPA